MTEDAATIPQDSGPQADDAQPQIDATGAEQSDHDPYVGAMAALGIDVTDEVEQPHAAAQPADQPEEPAEAEQAAQSDNLQADAEQQQDEQSPDGEQLPVELQDGKVVIKGDDAVLVDPDGNEWRAADVIWRTQQYHRKLAEKDQEIREVKSAVEALDAELLTDPAGLARKIMQTAADPASRLAAVADVLRDTGLVELADQVAAAMQQSGLQYDPLQAERLRLDRERQQFEQQRQAEQRRAAIEAEEAQLRQRLGRDITDDEWQAIADVAAAHNLERPGAPLTLAEAYDRAAALIEYRRAQQQAGRRQKPAQPQKPPTTVEPAAPTPRPKDSGRAIDYLDGALQALGVL